RGENHCNETVTTVEGPPCPVTHNLAYESSLQNRILALENKDPSWRCPSRHSSYVAQELKGVGRFSEIEKISFFQGATGDVSDVIQVENSLNNLEEIRNSLKGKGKATKNHIVDEWAVLTRIGIGLPINKSPKVVQQTFNNTYNALLSDEHGVAGATGDVAKCYSSTSHSNLEEIRNFLKYKGKATKNHIEGGWVVLTRKAIGPPNNKGPKVLQQTFNNTYDALLSDEHGATGNKKNCN
ncbi:hypothetical protein HAX54_025910, partial [Datura stramonium]|nr:hypothetical protein [Datura stramonium]